MYQKVFGPTFGLPDRPYKIVNSDQALNGNERKKGTWGMLDYWLE
jgi:hypothetical protein